MRGMKNTFIGRQAHVDESQIINSEKNKPRLIYMYTVYYTVRIYARKHIWIVQYIKAVLLAQIYVVILIICKVVNSIRILNKLIRTCCNIRSTNAEWKMLLRSRSWVTKLNKISRDSFLSFLRYVISLGFFQWRMKLHPDYFR